MASNKNTPSNGTLSADMNRSSNKIVPSLSKQPLSSASISSSLSSTSTPFGSKPTTMATSAPSKVSLPIKPILKSTVSINYPPPSSSTSTSSFTPTSNRSSIPASNVKLPLNPLSVKFTNNESTQSKIQNNQNESIMTPVNPTPTTISNRDGLSVKINENLSQASAPSQSRVRFMDYDPESEDEKNTIYADRASLLKPKTEPTTSTTSLSKSTLSTTTNNNTNTPINTYQPSIPIRSNLIPTTIQPKLPFIQKSSDSSHLVGGERNGQTVQATSSIINTQTMNLIDEQKVDPALLRMNQMKTSPAKVNAAIPSPSSTSLPTSTSTSLPKKLVSSPNATNALRQDPTNFSMNDARHVVTSTMLPKITPSVAPSKSNAKLPPSSSPFSSLPTTRPLSSLPKTSIVSSLSSFAKTPSSSLPSSSQLLTSRKPNTPLRSSPTSSLNTLPNLSTARNMLTENINFAQPSVSPDRRSYASSLNITPQPRTFNLPTPARQPITTQKATPFTDVSNNASLLPNRFINTDTRPTVTHTPRTPTSAHLQEDRPECHLIDSVTHRYDYWLTLLRQLRMMTSTNTTNEFSRKRIKLLQLAPYGVWDPRWLADIYFRQNIDNDTPLLIEIAQIIIIMNMLTLRRIDENTPPHYELLKFGSNGSREDTNGEENDGNNDRLGNYGCTSFDSQYSLQIQKVYYDSMIQHQQQQSSSNTRIISFHNINNLRSWLPSGFESCPVNMNDNAPLSRNILYYFIGLTPHEIEIYNQHTEFDMTLLSSSSPTSTPPHTSSSSSVSLKTPAFTRNSNNRLWPLTYNGSLRFDDILQITCLSPSPMTLEKEMPLFKTAFVHFVSTNTLASYSAKAFSTESFTIPGMQNQASVNASMWDMILRSNLAALLPRTEDEEHQILDYALHGDLYDPFRVTQINHVHILRDVAASGYAFLNQPRLIDTLLCTTAPNYYSAIQPQVHLFHILKVMSFIIPALTSNMNVIILGTLPDTPVEQGNADAIDVQFTTQISDVDQSNRQAYLSNNMHTEINQQDKAELMQQLTSTMDLSQIFAPPLATHSTYDLCPYHYHLGMYLHFALRIPCANGPMPHIISLASPIAKIAFQEGYSRYSDDEIDILLYGKVRVKETIDNLDPPLNIWDQLVRFYTAYFVSRGQKPLY